MKKPGRLRSAINALLGLGPEYVEQWASLGTTSTSGTVITEDKMLSLDAVWACTRLISETIATLPLAMYERTTTGKRPAPLHPLHVLIHDQPNAHSTASVHWESTVAAMLLRGNARAEKLVIGNTLVGLRFLEPSRLSASRNSRNEVEFYYLEADGKRRTIPESRIWNIPGFSLDGRYGVSVIQHGANVFGNAYSAEMAAAKTWENGLLQTTYFKMENVLTPTQREEFRENIAALSGALHAGKSPLLEGGMSVGDVGLNPDDAQLLESRAFSVEQICRWFRVPPFMVGHSEKSTSWGTGIEHQMIGFLTFTLAPWLRRIEQAISKDLLSPADRVRYYAKFSVEGLLRADSAARATFYAAMVNNGIYFRDEVREFEDMQPVGGNAAKLTVQSAMTLLDSIGTTTADQQARAALVQWLADERTST